jgi:tetratricopeptide (TPR) repeat protein
MIKKILFSIFLLCSINSACAKDFFLEGMENVKQEKWLEAKVSFEKETQKNNSDFSAFYNLALVNAKLNQHPDLIYNMEKSLKLNPKNNSARNHIVKSKTSLGLIPEYKENASVFKIKMMSFSLKAYRIASVFLSLSLSILIFLWFKKKSNFLLLLTSVVFFLLIFSVYFTIEKQEFARNLTHGIIFQKIGSAFVANEGNARTKLTIMEGEKVKIFEQNNSSDRIGIYTNDENIVWIPKNQIRLF